MSVTALILLSSLGLAITVQAQSCSKPVGGPNMNLKGDAILNNEFPDGSSVSFSCSTGYTPAGGSPTIKCTAGSWSRVTLVCERKNCGAFPDVDNGYVEYPQGTEYGDTAVITCNVGYNLVGKNEIRCDVQGWDSRTPVCEVVRCTSPGVIVNGTFNPQSEIYNYRDVVKYTCRSDTALNGSAGITCSEDGKFSPGPPTCVWVDCKDPGITNAEFVDGSRPPYRYLASVTYRCISGYEMTGSSTLKCNINSQWTPGIPSCNLRSPSTPKTTTTTTTRKPLDPSDPKDPNDGNQVSPGLIGGIVAVVLLIVVVGIGASYCFGVPAFLWKKRGKRGSPVGPTLLDVNGSSERTVTRSTCECT